jgi:RNA polymerase sigma-70 factor (ECF subfamily)
MHARAGQLLEAAYTEHRAALVRHLAFITHDADVAEDLAQDAFLRLGREIEAGRRPDAAGPWLRRVATNLAMSRGRHLQVVDRRAGSLPRPAEPAPPEAIACDAELAAAIAEALERMNAAERRALTLAANGFAGEEIAVALDRSPGAVRTLLCRARAKIRRDITAAGLATA